MAEREKKPIILNIGSICENCSVFLEEEQVKLRLEQLAEELARSGLLRDVSFGWRWDGSKKNKVSFKASALATDVSGSLMVANGVATLRMNGRVELREMHGKVNEGKIQALVRAEVVKSLRAAFDARSTISSAGATQYIMQKVLHQVHRELEAERRTKSAGRA